MEVAQIITAAYALQQNWGPLWLHRAPVDLRWKGSYFQAFFSCVKGFLSMDIRLVPDVRKVIVLTSPCLVTCMTT